MNSSSAFARMIARLACLGGILALTMRLAAADHTTAGPLNAHLEPLRSLLGKTWRGEFKTPGAQKPGEKPAEDIARWERALNGEAVRILHSINNGASGGETLIYWSKEKNSLVYRYFTTSGYETEGTLTITGNRFATLERVTGEADGVTEVKATTIIRADGTYGVAAEYLKKGKWEPGHTAVYHDDPKAEVMFK